MAKRRKGKKRFFFTQKTLKWLLPVIGLIGGIGCWIHFRVQEKIESQLLTALKDFGFSVENVLVEGCERTDAGTVRQFLAATQNPCIFALDITALRRNLESLPWVRSAIIQRRLPSTVYIRVAERLPIALWQDQHALHLIDAEGALLGTEFIEQFSSLPTLIGKGAPQAAATLFSALELFPLLRQRLVSAVRVGNRRWDIFLSEEVRVRLPEGNEEVALRFLDTLQREDGFLGRTLQCVDLRFPGKIIVRSRKGTLQHERNPSSAS
ncbi:MAG: FtsQ-type POTRA domain-containing protein [Holosporales bacterium]|jgi:cell division protein FtsQ|nr:FtsQ-type POTRA domain-containing protein [Holosporales bacterium]